MTSSNLQELRQRALAAVGRFHSTHDDIATRHDDYLAEAEKVNSIVEPMN